MDTANSILFRSVFFCLIRSYLIIW
uniref:Uncharacterized protein n=1 Tax=Arundo donax TaxID=35708 RepID=A0A0A9BC67_ARUDO